MSSPEEPTVPARPDAARADALPPHDEPAAAPEEAEVDEPETDEEEEEEEEFDAAAEFGAEAASAAELGPAEFHADEETARLDAEAARLAELAPEEEPVEVAAEERPAREARGPRREEREEREGELRVPTTQPDGRPAEIDPRKLDPDALKVVLRLSSHGHETYLVGGCVRDLLAGRTPKDFDVATDATPNEVRAIFRNCRLIGRRFRLAHVYFKGGKIIEVSTFRANAAEVQAVVGAEDAETEEQAGNDLLITHDNVFGTAQEDSRRRDFTMNGLFYDVTTGQVIDYVRGRRDLDEHYVRTIGNPEVRMREDPVRILRAVRFATKLGFDIESRTYAAMEGAVEDLPRCAPARLLEDTFRCIRGGVAGGSLRLLNALDALKFLLPPLADHLKRHGAEGERTVFAFADALDRRVAQGDVEFDDAMLLAAILTPVARAAPAPEGEEEGGKPPSVAQGIEDLLAEFVQTARLPRRIAERCRMLLLAQRTLTGERRRRGGLAAFRRHPVFRDALAVFEVLAEATGEYREQLESWKAGEAPRPQPGTPEEGGPAKKRRRRRRRGGGRRNGEGGGSGGPAGGGEG